jgi:DNA-binding NarL/FixJ family response regulator
MTSAAADPIRVFVVAPPIAAWGLERLVQTRAPQFCVAGVQPSIGPDDPLPGHEAGDVLVMDAEGGGTVDSLSRMQGMLPANLIVLTAWQDPALLEQAIFAGVRGVVRKSDPPENLLKAIEKVWHGELWIDRGTTTRIVMEMSRRKAAHRDDPEQHRIRTLTTRERQTVSALASDVAAPGKVIAGRLCISEHTLRNHLTSIYSKLGVSNRLDLYAFATRHRLGELE